jgi:phage terminase large subunit GpA-like protein
VVLPLAPELLGPTSRVRVAKRNSKQRIDPLIEESEVLRERVKERRSRDSGNTVLSKEFPGGVLILTGANSAVGLRSMPARYLFLDEVDGYPGDVEGERDPILLAERRSATFQRRKILLVSTPKTKSLSRIQREYEASDQRRYFVPCPHCGEPQTLEFENLRWPEGRLREAEYACAHCGALIGERHKTWMLEHGEWRTTAPGDGRTAGFHLSSLYSPVGWFSWRAGGESINSLILQGGELQRARARQLVRTNPYASNAAASFAAHAVGCGITTRSAPSASRPRHSSTS